MTDILGKTFVKPQIIPPFHSYQIAKPMVGHFMYDCITKTDHLLCRNWIFKNVQIIKSHNTCILHCSPLVLMGEDLVILVEGVGVAEIVLEMLH